MIIIFKNKIAAKRKQNKSPDAFHTQNVIEYFSHTNFPIKSATTSRAVGMMMAPGRGRGHPG
jgi:hypothetical protein